MLIEGYIPRKRVELDPRSGHQPIPDEMKVSIEQAKILCPGIVIERIDGRDIFEFCEACHLPIFWEDKFVLSDEECYFHKECASC